MAAIYVNKAGNEISKEQFDKLNLVLKSRYSVKNPTVKVPKEVTDTKKANKEDK